MSKSVQRIQGDLEFGAAIRRLPQFAGLGTLSALLLAMRPASAKSRKSEKGSLHSETQVYHSTATLTLNEVAVHIEISVRDGVPIYRQIVNQVRYLIASGQLAVGEELPPIRTLAEQLSVTPNTIVKAYDALQTEGLLVKRQGAGTYVSELASPIRKSEQRKILTQRADALLAEARQFSFSYEEVLELIHKRQAALDRTLPKGPGDV